MPQIGYPQRGLQNPSKAVSATVSKDLRRYFCARLRACGRIGREAVAYVQGETLKATALSLAVLNSRLRAIPHGVCSFKRTKRPL